MSKRVSFSARLENLIPSHLSDSSEELSDFDTLPDIETREKKKPVKSSSSSSPVSSPDEPPTATTDVDEHKKMLMTQQYLLQKVIRTECEQDRTSMLRPCNSCEFLDPHHPGGEKTCCWGLFTLLNNNKSRPIPEFWLVSAPRNREPFVSPGSLRDATLPHHLSMNYKFHIPPLRMGSLNQLINLTDALAKMDVETEKVIKKVANFMYAVLDEDEDVIEYFDVYNLDIPTYVTSFAWNAAKYPYKKPIPVLYGRIKETIDLTNSQLLRRMKDFNDLDRDLEKIHRQLTGTLKTRSLHGIVKADDVIKDSSFLTTLFVVVDLHSVKEWMKTYETLCDMVVPKSAVELKRDEKYALFAVAVCKRQVDVFVRKATSMNFTVREFEFEEGKSGEEEELLMTLSNLRKTQIKILYRWIKVTFSECFSTWMHIKAILLFVESVLRYGLPADFHYMLLMPLKEEKLREVLKKLFSSLDTQLTSGLLEDIPGGLAAYQVEEYFPYVFLRIQIGLFAEHRHA